MNIKFCYNEGIINNEQGIPEWSKESRKDILNSWWKEKLIQDRCCIREWEVYRPTADLIVERGNEPEVDKEVPDVRTTSEWEEEDGRLHERVVRLNGYHERRPRVYERPAEDRRQVERCVQYGY